MKDLLDVLLYQNKNKKLRYLVFEYVYYSPIQTINLMLFLLVDDLHNTPNEDHPENIYMHNRQSKNMFRCYARLCKN